MSIHQTKEALEEISSLLAAGHIAAAQLAVEAARLEAAEEAAQYEGWAEREMLAEAAWQMHGSRLIEDMEAGEIPF